MLILVNRLQPLPVGKQSSAVRGQRAEQLAEGVVSVEWTLPGVDEQTSRLHLHVGNGTKPPVDLAIDEHDGRLLGVQLLLQDEEPGKQAIFGDGMVAEHGVPVVDLTPWRDEEQILDHLFDPTVAWEPVGTLAVRIARTAGLPAKECFVEGASLVLDERNLVLGVRIRGFSESEVAMVGQGRDGYGG